MKTIKNHQNSNKSKSVQAHPTALIASSAIGVGTRVWAFTNILEGAVIGIECNICDHVFIENQVVVGDRVTVKCGVQLWDGITLEDDVFVGPNVTFTNDKLPRSGQHLESSLRTVVKKGASLGANSTILPGLTIGSNAMVGAGAVVTRHVPPNAVVIGNPARISGYTSSKSIQNKFSVPSGGTQTPSRTEMGVGNALLIKLPEVLDLRGALSFGEVGGVLPFAPKRYFLVYNVPTEEVRGEHAHKELHQFLICVAGQCSLVVDDGRRRAEATLNHPTRGAYIPPMVWSAQFRYSKDAVLMVLASDTYKEGDYIRNYDEYLELTAR